MYTFFDPCEDTELLIEPLDLVEVEEGTMQVVEIVATNTAADAYGEPDLCGGIGLSVTIADEDQECLAFSVSSGTMLLQGL